MECTIECIEILLLLCIECFLPVRIWEDGILPIPSLSDPSHTFVSCLIYFSPKPLSGVKELPRELS